MSKVAFFELPTNIRIAFVFTCVGVFFLFLYSIAIKSGIDKGVVNINFVFFNVGLYLFVLFQLKRRILLSYIVALAVLGPFSFYNLYIIYQLYSENMEKAFVYVWWPLIHFLIFSVCFTLLLAPKTILFYRNKPLNKFK